jgi:hypothetical protein
MGEDYCAWDQEEIESEDRQMRAAAPAARRVYGAGQRWPQKDPAHRPEYSPTRVVTQSDVRYGVCDDCGEPVGRYHATNCPVLEKPTLTLEQARENLRKAGF